MDNATLRERTLGSLTRLGYPVNKTLPLLDASGITKSAREIEVRCLVLHACCASSYGYPVARARRWLSENGLVGGLSPSEHVLMQGLGAGADFRVRPEAIWMLRWVLDDAPGFHLHEGMPSDAVDSMPNLLAEEPANDWMDVHSLRDSNDVLAALDFYYCLHWAWTHRELTGQPTNWQFPRYAVVERRRALEWCLGVDPWDQGSLDT